MFLKMTLDLEVRNGKGKIQAKRSFSGENAGEEKHPVTSDLEMRGPDTSSLTRPAAINPTWTLNDRFYNSYRPKNAPRMLSNGLPPRRDSAKGARHCQCSRRVNRARLLRAPISTRLTQNAWQSHRRLIALVEQEKLMKWSSLSPSFQISLPMTTTRPALWIKDRLGEGGSVPRYWTAGKEHPPSKRV